VGRLRAQPRACAGIIQKQGGASAVRLPPERQPRRLVLVTDPRRSTAGPVPAAKLKASCCKASAGKRLKSKCLFNLPS
jgi:shikimate kinase